MKSPQNLHHPPGFPAALLSHAVWLYPVVSLSFLPKRIRQLLVLPESMQVLGGLVLRLASRLEVRESG